MVINGTKLMALKGGGGVAQKKVRKILLCHSKLEIFRIQ